MSFFAAVLKWGLENPKLVRFFAAVIAIMLVAIWFHHVGARSATRALYAKEQSVALHVKEQYDEINSHRTDDSGLLKLLRAGEF